MRNFLVALEEWQYFKLMKLSTSGKKRIPMSEHIRRAVSQYLEEQKKEIKNEAQSNQ